MITTLVIAGVLLAAPLQVPYEPHEYHFLTNRGPWRLTYSLFMPRSIEPTDRYPLLVWLEHKGELRTSDLITAFGPDYAHPQFEKYHFFMLMIPLPPPKIRYCAGGDFLAADANLVYQIMQKTMRECSIDPDRVYLAGASHGSRRCWEMAMRYPELFAALVTMGFGGEDPSRADKLKAIPAWAFHNLNDKYIPAEDDMRMAAVLKSEGGNVCLTLLPGSQHDCWSAAFQKYNVMAWMLEQRRGAVCWTPPGCPPWKWWHILLLPCAVLVLARLSWHFGLKRR